MPKARQVGELKILRDFARAAAIGRAANNAQWAGCDRVRSKREVLFLNVVILLLKSGAQSTSAGPKGPIA